MSTIDDWLPEARIQAAQCWCDEETRHIEMDAALAEAFARRLAAWMDTAALYASNAEYWRNQVQPEATADPRIPATALHPAPLPPGIGINLPRSE